MSQELWRSRKSDPAEAPRVMPAGKKNRKLKAAGKRRNDPVRNLQNPASQATTIEPAFPISPHAAARIQAVAAKHRRAPRGEGATARPITHVDTPVPRPETTPVLPGPPTALDMPGMSDGFTLRGIVAGRSGNPPQTPEGDGFDLRNLAGQG